MCFRLSWCVPTGLRASDIAIVILNELVIPNRAEGRVRDLTSDNLIPAANETDFATRIVTAPASTRAASRAS